MRAAGIMTSVHGQVLIRTAAVNASEQKEENLQSKGRQHMQTKPYAASILYSYLTFNHFPRILSQKCAPIFCSGHHE